MNREAANLIFVLPNYVDRLNIADFIKKVSDYLSQFGASLELTSGQMEGKWMPVYLVHCPEEYVGIVKYGLRRIGVAIV